MSKWPLTKIGKLLTPRQITPDPKKISSGEFSIVGKISFASGQIEIRDHAKTNTNMITIMPGDLVISGINAGKGAIAIYGKENKNPATATIHYSSYEVDSDLADIEYLWYFFRSEVFREVLRLGLPNGIKTELRPNKFITLEIPLPLLPEQKRTVKKIKEIEEKAEELIKANNNRQKKSESLIASVLNKLFTGNPNWESAELEKVAPLVTDNFFPSSKPREQFRYLTLDSIESYTSKLLDVPNVEGQKIKSSTSKFDDQHVLYAKLRPYLNKVIAPDFSGISTTELIVFKPNQEKIAREFLVYFLRNPKFVDEASKTSAGTKMPRVNTKWLIKQKVRFPKSTTEQLGIVSDLKKLESMIDKLKLDINKVDNYVSALMPSVLAKAFNGEL